MSGEAGASIAGTHYSIFVGSGIIVSVDPEPGAGGDPVAEYFADESRPYERWLARARPALDALFAEEAPRLGLAALAPDLPDIAGTIIADDPNADARDAAHFREYHRGGPIAVSFESYELLPDQRSLRLLIAVTGRIRGADLRALAARAAAVLIAHLNEDAG
jgi:hypothetical protein